MPEPLRRANAVSALDQSGDVGRAAGLGAGYAADQVLEADDAYGRSQGLVVVSDKVSWTMLDALLELATYGSLLHKEIDHQRGRECRWCRQAETMWRTALINPLIAARRTTATNLHADIRDAVEEANGVAGGQ